MRARRVYGRSPLHRGQLVARNRCTPAVVVRSRGSEPFIFHLLVAACCPTRGEQSESSEVNESEPFESAAEAGVYDQIVTAWQRGSFFGAAFRAPDIMDCLVHLARRTRRLGPARAGK